MNWDDQELQRAIASWNGLIGQGTAFISSSDMQAAVARGAVVWDIRPKTAARSGLGGERAASAVEWLLADSFGGNLIPRTAIADRLNALGITPDRAVVICAARGCLDALIALRALHCIGVHHVMVCHDNVGVAQAVTPATSS